MRDRPRNLLVCLDNAATTQNPQAVMDRVTHFYANENSNIYWAPMRWRSGRPKPMKPRASTMCPTALRNVNRKVTSA
jgi:hypothetical protein